MRQAIAEKEKQNNVLPQRKLTKERSTRQLSSLAGGSDPGFGSPTQLPPLSSISGALGVVNVSPGAGKRSYSPAVRFSCP